MKNKEHLFIGHNLAKFNTFWHKNESAVLMYNLSFKSKQNSHTVFVFPKESLTKKAMINIFKGKDQNYSGFFEYNNQIYFPNSKNNINKIISLIDLEDFYSHKYQNKNLFFRIQSRLSKKINNNNFINFAKDFYLNFEDNKNQALFDIKKIDLENNRNVNNEMEKMIEIIDNSLNKLNLKINKLRSIKTQKESLELIKAFYLKYQTYLDRRVQLLYHKNDSIIQYLSKVSRSSNYVNDLDLTNKINTLNKEINFKKISVKEENKLNLERISNQLNEVKNKNLIILRIKQNDFKFFVKKNKFYIDDASKNSINTTKHLYKLCTNLFFINFIKKHSKKILYLNNEQIESLINEIDAQYNLVLFEVNSFIKNYKNINNKKAMEQWISTIFKLDINYFISLSASNYNQINESHKTTINDGAANLDLTSENKLFWNNNIEWKKIQFQNLQDEYNWVKSNNMFSLNKKIVQLNLEAHKNVSIYKNLKIKIDQKLTEFIRIRNYIIERLSDPNDQSDWNDTHKFFNLINQEYFSIFNFLKNRSSEIENFLKNHSTELRRIDYKSFLIQSKIFNLVNLCGLDGTILDKSLNQLSNLELAKFFLAESILSDKPIIVANNLLHYLSSDERDIFINLYKKIQKIFPRIWIHLVNFYPEISMLNNSYVNVMKDGLNIEFGNIEDVIKNPFYQISADLLTGNEAGKNDKSESKHDYLIHFNNDNKNFLYDYYKLNNNHCVYASIEEIYQKTQKIPATCKWTFNPLKIEEFKNHLMQQASYKDQSKNVDKILEFQEQEGIIIDVR